MAGLLFLAGCHLNAPPAASQTAADSRPAITKVEPPNWWLGLTPSLMVLLSGHRLEATRVACNLPEVIVERSEATQGGDYLFVWLKLDHGLRSGTVVCRATTPLGQTSFELPVANRQPTARRFHGLDSNDVMYLILPDRFANGDPANDEPAEFPGFYDRSKSRAWHGGDLRGIRDHLDYLKALGVTALWLTPVVKNGATEDYHGYGAVDLYAVDPHLGTLDDYQELAAALRQRQMKLFFDAVPNHVGPKHPWVSEPPRPDWFHGSGRNHLNTNAPFPGSFYARSAAGAASHDPLEVLADPHGTQSLRRDLTEGWFGGVLPDLNTENPVVQEYLLQNAIWWIESAGLDGLRVDTFPYVSRAFWEQWHTGLRRIYPNLTTIGEVFHPDPAVTSFFVGGKKDWDGVDTELSTVFDYPLFFALRDVLLGKAPAGRLADVLRQDQLYPHADWLVPFFANHDVPRLAGAPGSSPQKLLSAFALLLTLRGIPQIYYGDEIGMEGGGDPDNRRDFPGGWTGDARNAFTEEGRTPQQQAIFAAVEKLLRLRRAHAALTRGKLFHLFSDDETYIFLRQTDDERILVVFNNSARLRTLTIPQAYTPAEGALKAAPLYGSGSADPTGKELRIAAPAQSVSIFDLH